MAGIALGIYGGFKVGERIRERPSWQYWAINAAAMVLGIVITTIGLIVAWDGLYVMGVALIAGCLTGLKYGYGKSVGLWRVHDSLMHTDQDMRD